MLYDTRNSPEVNIGQWLIQMDHAVSAESEPELLQLDTRKYENIKYQITGSTESSEVRNYNFLSGFYFYLSGRWD